MPVNCCVVKTSIPCIEPDECIDQEMLQRQRHAHRRVNGVIWQRCSLVNWQRWCEGSNAAETSLGGQ